jgi:hypothetical protein
MTTTDSGFVSQVRRLVSNTVNWQTARGGEEADRSTATSQVRTGTVKSRRVTFFVERQQIRDVVTTIESEILPAYSARPHFLGFLALQSELGSRPEVVVISLWNDDLKDSEELSETFRDEIQRVTGMMPARQAFDILRVMVRDTNGDICLDSP